MTVKDVGGEAISPEAFDAAGVAFRLRLHFAGGPLEARSRINTWTLQSPPF